jgi:hypothetical protein
MKRSIFLISVQFALTFAIGALGQSERNKHRLLVLTDIDGYSDGDSQTYQCMYYPELGIYGERHDLNAVRIMDYGAMKATLTIPGDAETDDSIHIILKVTDDGDPLLTRHRQFVIQVLV